MTAGRISQFYKDKKNTRRGKVLFKPDLLEWTKACATYCYDYQIVKHFMISKETFYAFLDRQRYEEEQRRPAEYLDAYKKGKNNSRLEAIDLLKNSARKAGSDEPASIIFYAKTFGGLVEAKDTKALELKKKEFALKQKEFLSTLAERYSLDFNELKLFAEKFFKDAKVEEI